MKTYKTLALSFPGVEEVPHFDRIAFRANKRIFSTLREKDQLVMVALNPEIQSVYCQVDPGAIYPVPGGWGKSGCTYVELKKISRTLLMEMLQQAYDRVQRRMRGRKPV